MCWKIWFYKKCCFVDVWLERSVCIHLEIFILWFLGIISFAGLNVLRSYCVLAIGLASWYIFSIITLTTVILRLYCQGASSHFCTVSHLPASYSCVCLLSQISFPSLLLAEDITGVFFLWEKVHKSIWFKLSASKNDFFVWTSPVYSTQTHDSTACSEFWCLYLSLSCIISLASWLFGCANC